MKKIVGPSPTIDSEKSNPTTPAALPSAVRLHLICGVGRL